MTKVHEPSPAAPAAHRPEPVERQGGSYRRRNLRRGPISYAADVLSSTGIWGCGRTESVRRCRLSECAGLVLALARRVSVGAALHADVHKLAHGVAGAWCLAANEVPLPANHAAPKPPVDLVALASYISLPERGDRGVSEGLQACGVHAGRRRAHYRSAERRLRCAAGRPGRLPDDAGHASPRTGVREYCWPRLPGLGKQAERRPGRCPRSVGEEATALSRRPRGTDRPRHRLRAAACRRVPRIQSHRAAATVTGCCAARLGALTEVGTPGGLCRPAGLVVGR